MRCKTCDYPLWNLKARQCPECGSAFVPSQFEFVGNSVKFGCPHCNQTYYGTGEKGHLVPPEFTCVTCHRPLRMDEMVLFPAEGLVEEQTKVDRFPWIQRKERGLWKSWFASLGMVMASPHRIMRAIPVDLASGQAWWFALFSWLMFMLAGVGLPLVVIGLIMAIMGDNDAIEPMLGGLIGVAGSLVGISIYLALWGLVTHGMLRLTGGTAHSIGRTYQCICISAGAFVLFAIPLVGPYCGTYVAWIWPVVSAIIMLRDGQQVHGGGATLAVLTLPGIFVLAAFIGYMILMAAIFSGTGPFAAGRGTWGTSITHTQSMAADIITYAAKHNGAGPAHGLELIDSPSATSFGFITSDSATGDADVPVGDQTMADVLVMQPNRQQLAVQGAIDALPANVVAHRVGDFVFTHHGVDLNNPPPGLWIVIMSPDPDVNGPPMPTQMIVIGHADGSVNQCPAPSITALLQIQNQLRAGAGLPPLPDPTTVTHDSPATSTPGAGDAEADDP